MADDIRSVLRLSGIPETGDAFLAALVGASSSVRGGLCDEATPIDGVIVECDVQPGSMLMWMALRPNASKGDRTPGRLERVRWSGDKPFRAYLFRVTNNDKIYTFVLPVACANVSLMSVKALPREPLTVKVDRVCDPMTGNLRATITAGGSDLNRAQRVSVSINGQAAGELTAPGWTMTSTKAGDYAFDAIDARGQSYPVAQRTLRVEACPMPAAAEARKIVGPTCSVVLSAASSGRGYQISVDATKSSTGANSVAPVVTVDLRDDKGVAIGQTTTLDGSLTEKVAVRRTGTYKVTATARTPQMVESGATRYEGSAVCEASVTIDAPGRAMSFFIDVLAGKDRRERPMDGMDMDFAQCSPLAGVKLGIAKQLRNNWEIAGAAGVAISLVTDHSKVKESALFVDAEINKYSSRHGMFIGTGISVWDLTRSDTWTPAWLLHAGVPLSRSERHPLYLMVEGRLYFDHIGNIQNNYLVWAGLRLHFRN
jgi:hypothetical protein